MKVSLTSIGFKILSIFLFICMTALLIIITSYADNFNLMAVIFCFLVVILCLLGVIVSFLHKIIIKENQVILRQIFSRAIPLEKIIDIKFSDQNKSNVIIFITQEKEYRIAGYTNILGYKSHMNHTEKIAEEIISFLEKTSSKFLEVTNEK